jgi:hypothetical protein
MPVSGYAPLTLIFLGIVYAGVAVWFGLISTRIHAAGVVAPTTSG